MGLLRATILKVFLLKRDRKKLGYAQIVPTNIHFSTFSCRAASTPRIPRIALDELGQGKIGYIQSRQPVRQDGFQDRVGLIHMR